MRIHVHKVHKHIMHYRYLFVDRHLYKNMYGLGTSGGRYIILFQDWSADFPENVITTVVATTAEGVVNDQRVRGCGAVGLGCKCVRVCVIRRNTPGEYFMCGAFIYFFISLATSRITRARNIMYGTRTPPT